MAFPTLNENQFMTGLVNMVGLIKLYATNTSKYSRNFVETFATETLSYGDTKVFPFTDLPTVRDYNPVSTVLEVTKVPANEEAISISEFKTIPISYNRYFLDMAFLSETGANQFIGYMLGQVESAKDNYLYNDIITELFAITFPKATQTVSVTVVDASTLATYVEKNNADTYNQKKIKLAIQNTFDNMQAFSADYNDIGYTQAIAPDDMRLIMCQPYGNEQVINLNAVLFGPQYIDKNFENPSTVWIPTNKVPTANKTTIGFLFHKKKMQYFYKYVTGGTFYDPSNLTNNHFFQMAYGKGNLKNLPGVKFVATAPVAA